MTVEKEDVYKAFWWLEHQRILFFAVFLIGTFLIFLLKSFKVHGGIVSFIAVSLMAVYAVLGVRHKIKVRLDVLGDNLYYLGFLFTLVSLSFSLYELGRGSADINGLLENFGLAIMTTLSGLALRVFFNQPKADITEYENAIRLSLTEAAANFVGETSKIGRDISTLRSVLNQYVEETRESQKHATESLNQAIDNQIGLLEKSSNKNQENIESLLEKLKMVQNSFAENFKNNSEAMSKAISKSMTQIENGATSFVSGFDEMGNSVNELHKTMSSLNSILSTWDTTIERIITSDDKIAYQLLESKKLIEESHKQFFEMGRELPTILRGTAEDFDTTVKSLSLSVAKISAEIEVNFETLSEAAVKVNNEVTNSMKAIQTLTEKIISNQPVLVIPGEKNV
jgi:hypothetical protein